MATLLVVLIRPVFSMFLGTCLTIAFSGATLTRRNLIRVCLLSALSLALIGTAGALWGWQTAAMLYPPLVHLPLSLFLIFTCRIPAPVTIVSVLSGYLCCQIPNWTGRVLASFFDHNLYVERISYIISIFLLLLLLQHYVVKPVQRTLYSSRKVLYLFGSIPLIYYLFDYATTVYSSLLYEGNWFAVHFMPTIMSAYFFLFVVVYHRETLQILDVQRSRDLVDAQLHQAEIELASMRRTQQTAAEYRHDMRHHLNLLRGYANTGDLEAIRTYLQDVQSGLDAITPKRFCGNETVNVICSYYVQQAQQLNIRFLLTVQLPEQLPLRDSELCTLLSNALENAFHAVESLPAERRLVTAKLLLHRSNVLISIENTFAQPVSLRNGLPQSDRPDHGYGARSIAGITNLRGGQYLFSTENDLFKLKIVLPVSRTDSGCAEPSDPT